MSGDVISIRRALISVSDKTGLVEFAQRLASRGIEILSTGGTASTLKKNSINVIDVGDYTGFPEILDGRIKTLHPKIHGGLLFIRGNKEHEATIATQNFKPIDLLINNLYPFEATLEGGGTFEACIENIDIGGPAMIRAAAKNHAGVVVLVDTADYAALEEELNRNNGATTAAFRKAMASKAFAKTAAYDGAISNWLMAAPQPNGKPSVRYPNIMNLQLMKDIDLRYGENPHQSAAFYKERNPPSGTVATATKVCGKELSYNNIADADAALECVKEFDTSKPTCVIVKHSNPCGVATGKTLIEAYRRAHATDSESAFGGIIAFNQPLDVTTIETILTTQFVEVLIAPEASSESIEFLSHKKNLRLLVTGMWSSSGPASLDYKKVNGGFLVQEPDKGLTQTLDVVTKRKPTETEKADMLFAMKVAKFVKSNAIVYARNSQTLGIGAGQMSRINSTRIAVDKAHKAGFDLKSSVVASDAFFPFADGLIKAAEAGVVACIQPGGSMRDAEVIKAADEREIAMIFTKMRHFRH